MGGFTSFAPEQQGMLSLHRSSLWSDFSCPELPEGVDWTDISGTPLPDSGGIDDRNSCSKGSGTVKSYAQISLQSLAE